VTLFLPVKNQLRRLRQRADAFGAERLSHFSTVLNDGHLLQVGVERTIGCPVGERDIMTEGRGLAAMSAFCHFLDFLSEQIRPACLEQAAYSTTKRILVQVECYS
jgi:hypothetical protein